MKKAIASSLNKLAEDLPLYFEEKPDTTLMTGRELKLTPLADVMELEDSSIYEIPIPKFVAVEHKQQVKDHFKRGGLEAVRGYVDKVMSSARY